MSESNHGLTTARGVVDGRVLYGKAAYEADCRVCPTYPDGGKRKAWEDLDELTQWTWTRAMEVAR